MYSSRTHLDALLKSIYKAQAYYDEVQTVFSDHTSTCQKNNWLFFIKPEITQANPAIQLEKVLGLILDKIDAFGLHIHSIRNLPATYLKRHDLIRKHYGVISQVASVGKKALGEDAKKKFTEIFGIEAGEAKMMGGLEFLEAYPFFNAQSLDCMWQNSQNHKLAGGTYIEKWQVDLESIYVLNAFHPIQLEHFTLPGRSIVVMNLSGNLDWADSRSRFAGATNPVNALPGSLRNDLYCMAAELGLPEISQSYNGIHLSAGPVEALLELQRFESDLDGDAGLLRFDAFPFGKRLKESFGKIPEEIIQNTLIDYKGKKTSVFDLTEELNSEEALTVLNKFLK